MRRLVAVLALIAAVAMLAAACGDDDSTSGTATPGPTRAATAKTAGTPAGADKVVAGINAINYPAELQSGTSLGKADAPVTIQMFEDFTCPHCLEFMATLEPDIIQQLVVPGKARLEFHYLPLRQSSVPAMVAAQCASEQGKFMDYRRRLFVEQAKADALPANQISDGLANAFSQDSLNRYAQELGLDTTKFQACYDGDAALNVIVGDARQSDTLGMKGTPTFVVNGQVLLSGYPSTIGDWEKLVNGTK